MSVIRIVAVLRSPRRVLSKEDGFSLIEVMAALFIFTLLTLGLVPLLTSSLRGSDNARADTIGKNAALKAMERVRGLPFYVSYATSTTRVDLLDLYYPDAASDITVGGNVLYRVSCPSNNLSNIACPRDVPAGYTITFEAQFVEPVAGGAQPAVGENATSYRNIDPARVDPNYSWSSPTSDTPPRQIVLMAITATWTVGEQLERYTLTSLLSDRNFGGRKLKATATLGYGADIYGAYDSRPGGAVRLSTGNVFVLTSDSDIEGRRLSTSRQVTTAHRGELQQDGGGSIASVAGATASLTAPPDQNPGTISAGAVTLVHPHFTTDNLVAEVGPSSITTPRALAASAMPSAIADTAITAPFSGSNYVTVRDPQLGPQDLNVLKLATRSPLVSIARNDGLPGAPTGVTAPIYGANDVAIGGTRTTTLADRVTAQTTVGIDRIYFLDTSWAELSDTEAVAEGGTLTGLGHLVVIDDFRASVICTSTSSGVGSGQARYQGTLYYWEDPRANNNRDDARYRRVEFDILANRSTTSSGPDPLAAIKAQNPLVYDHTSANQRTFLFGTKAAGGVAGQLGYISDWNSLTTPSFRVESSTDPTGAAVETVNATIDGAIEIQTADLDADRQDTSALALSLGSLSCYAQDAR